LKRIIKLFALIILVVFITVSCKDLNTGDVNGDGSATISDYTLIRMHYLGLNLLTGAQLARADVNEDGIVDETDGDLVRDYILDDLCE
jgi:hypothetical protein